jgi:hypothetical protein
MKHFFALKIINVRGIAMLLQILSFLIKVGGILRDMLYYSGSFNMKS